MDNGATGLDLSRTNRALTLYGRLYPGTGSASQASRYLFDNATEIESSGPFKVNTSMRLQGFTTGGTPQAFPTGASPTSVIMSTDVGATLLSIGVGYVTISIDGTNRKVLYVA